MKWKVPVTPPATAEESAGLVHTSETFNAHSPQLDNENASLLRFLPDSLAFLPPKPFGFQIGVINQGIVAVWQITPAPKAGIYHGLIIDGYSKKPTLSARQAIKFRSSFFQPDSPTGRKTGFVPPFPVNPFGNGKHLNGRKNVKHSRFNQTVN